MSFRVKYVQGEQLGLLRHDGSVWNCKINTRKIKPEEIEQALKEGKDVEATVKFPKNGIAVATNFEVVEEEPDSLEDQRMEYEMLGGEY